MTAWLVAMVVLAATAVAPPGAHAQSTVNPKCPVGTVKIGEQRTQSGEKIIVQARCRRMTDAELVNEFTRVDALVKGDRAKIDAFRSRYLPQIQGEIEEWERLAEHQRHELYLIALDAAIGSAVSRHAAKLNQNRDLLKEEARYIREVLENTRQLEIRSSDLHAVLLQLGEARRASDVMRTVERFQSLPTHVVSAAKADHGYEAVAQAMLGGLHAVAPDPMTHLMMSGTEMVGGLLFEHGILAIGRERVDQLSTVAASELKAIEGIMKVYKPRVDERAELRRVAQSRGIQLPRQ